MYTRCPGCQAVYELDAALLGQAAGVARCGNCGKTYNTLPHLFDRRPDETDEPVAGDGMPPLLEQPELVQAELPVMLTDADDEETAGPDPEPEFDPLETRNESNTKIWAAACSALALALVVQAWMLWQTPGSPVRSWLGQSDVEVHIDPNEAIQVVSRDMHAHPSLDDAIVVSASLRNQERQPIDFPVLEVRFYDASQQVLGARRVQPEEYLHDPDAIARGMPADTVIPLLMEIVIGSTRPAGFQIRFY